MLALRAESHFARGFERSEPWVAKVDEVNKRSLARSAKQPFSVAKRAVGTSEPPVARQVANLDGPHRLSEGSNLRSQPECLHTRQSRASSFAGAARKRALALRVMVAI